MIRSVLLFSSFIATAFSTKFTKVPEDVYLTLGAKAEMVWEYDLEGDALNGIVWELRHESNPPSEILRVDAQGQVTPQGNFPGASFTAPATLILNPMRMEDTGEITCTIYLKSQTVNDQVSTNIVAVDDLKYVSINLTDDSHFTKDNKIWSIKYHVQISFDVLVESDSGAPMEVDAFQKCGEGQENQIGPECTKGSGNCTFETSAGCDGFTEGLVTIRATVKHPAFDEAKEATWSYNVEGGSGLAGWAIALIVIGAISIIAGVGFGIWKFACGRKGSGSAAV